MADDERQAYKRVQLTHAQSKLLSSLLNPSSSVVHNETNLERGSQNSSQMLSPGKQFVGTEVAGLVLLNPFIQPYLIDLAALDSKGVIQV